MPAGDEEKLHKSLQKKKERKSEGASFIFSLVLKPSGGLLISTQLGLVHLISGFCHGVNETFALLGC
jgi:hypothetical protein